MCCAVSETGKERQEQRIWHFLKKKQASMRKSLALKFVYEYGITVAETGRRLGVTTNAAGCMVRNR
jgi:hypothetical protein